MSAAYRNSCFCFLILVICLIGCGPSPNKYIYKLGNGHAVAITYTASLSAQTRGEIVSAAKYTINCWEVYHQQRLAPTFIIVHDGLTFNTGDPADGGDIIGIWNKNSIVQVAAGPKNCLAGLFHEFCHRQFYLIGHTDDRWVYWDLFDQKCYKEILERR